MTKKLLFLFVFISLNTWGQTAEQIVDKYLDKIGGKKLETVHAILQKGEMVTNGMSIPMTNYQDTSGRMYSKLNLMGNEIIAVAFDGEKGYVFDNASFGYRDIPDSLTHNFKEKAKNIFGNFYKYKQAGQKVKYLGKQKFEDATYDAVLLTFSKPLEGKIKDLIAYFDPDTSLLKAIKIVADGQIVITKPVNYKSFDGILFPEELITEVDGNNVMTMKFNEIQINPPAPDSKIFIKPEQ